MLSIVIPVNSLTPENLRRILGKIKARSRKRSVHAPQPPPMASPSASEGQTVDLASLSAQQLSSIKKRLDDELEHLTSSFQKLRAAQSKFRECLTSIKDGVSSNTAGRLLLVPLTTSLYVSGTLANSEKVIVDVGTGYYVEKTTRDAVIFYNSKIADLGRNLKDLEAIVQGKSNNLRVVEDVLRQKVISGSVNAALSPQS